jgi:hypothetical protein
LVPTVTTPRTPLHSILFADLVFQLLTCALILAGSSVLIPLGFQTIFYRVKESVPSPSQPNHRLLDQASLFLSPEDRVVQLRSRPPGTHVSHLVRRVTNLWSTGIYRPVANFGFRQQIGVGVYTSHLLLPMQLGVMFESVERARNLKPSINSLELITIRPSLLPLISDLNGLQNLKTLMNVFTDRKLSVS